MRRSCHCDGLAFSQRGLHTLACRESRILAISPVGADDDRFARYLLPPVRLYCDRHLLVSDRVKRLMPLTAPCHLLSGMAAAAALDSCGAPLPGRIVVIERELY